MLWVPVWEPNRVSTLMSLAACFACHAEHGVCMSKFVWDEPGAGNSSRITPLAVNGPLPSECSLRSLCLFRFGSTGKVPLLRSGIWVPFPLFEINGQVHWDTRQLYSQNWPKFCVAIYYTLNKENASKPTQKTFVVAVFKISSVLSKRRWQKPLC